MMIDSLCKRQGLLLLVVESSGGSYLDHGPERAIEVTPREPQQRRALRRGDTRRRTGRVAQQR